ncbi:hypothetical protein V6243_05690 [Cobetia marina]|uniref:Uncharacterized protein n=1 Tax=Cobetia marina TaxID=28258 RepID=A0ABU9GEU8_COBMA
MPLSSLRNQLFKQRHVEVLVIKQIDGELLHVCGVGVLEGSGSVNHKRRELSRDNHAFPVRMHEGNQVLQPQDFNRLVLLEEVQLHPRGCRPREAVSLEVEGHRYRVAHTPMRCWHFKGLLKIERTQQGLLLSTEDMSLIRAKALRRPAASTTSSVSSDRTSPLSSWRNGDTRSRTGQQGQGAGTTPRKTPLELYPGARELELEPKY